MKKYLVISRCEDEPYLHYFIESNLRKALNDGVFEGHKFLNQSDWDGNIMEFPSHSVIIFCGDTVIPTPVKKVTEYRL
jgi:hypothetical protein